MNAATPERQKLLTQVRAALLAGGDVMGLEDMIALAQRGQIRLFHREDAVVGAEILSFPRRRIGAVFMAAGNVRSIVALDAEVSAWAREWGASFLTAEGRPEWARIGRRIGWHPQAMVFVKELHGGSA